MNSNLRNNFVRSLVCTVFDFVCNSSSVNNPQPIVYYG